MNEIKLHGRYDYAKPPESCSDLRECLSLLIDQLCEEEFEEPDFEHQRISLSCGDWSIGTSMEGLTWLSDYSEDHDGPKRYIQDVPRSELLEMYLAVANGHFEEAKQYGWKEYDDLPPFKTEFYLYANDPKCNAIHKAASKGDVEAIRKLIKEGADLEVADSWGRTAPHRAICVPHVEVVELLLENDADVNAKDNQGETPLHLAVWCEDHDIAIDVMKLLIDHVAEVNAKNNEDSRPIDGANTRCADDLIRFLQGQGRIGRGYSTVYTRD